MSEVKPKRAYTRKPKVEAVTETVSKSTEIIPRQPFHNKGKKRNKKK